MNSGVTEEQVTQIIDLNLFDEPKEYNKKKAKGA